MLETWSKLAKVEGVGVCVDGRSQGGRRGIYMPMRRLHLLGYFARKNTCQHPRAQVMRSRHLKGDSPPPKSVWKAWGGRVGLWMILSYV